MGEVGGADLELVPERYLRFQLFGLFSCQQPPLLGAVLADDFSVLFGLLGSDKGGIPDDLTDALNALNTGSNLTLSGYTSMFPFLLLQYIGFRLEHSTGRHQSRATSGPGSLYQPKPVRHSDRGHSG